MMVTEKARASDGIRRYRTIGVFLCFETELAKFTKTHRSLLGN